MATTLVNLVFVPCTENPTLTTTKVSNAAAVFRTPADMPLNLSGGSSIPKGPQVWPV